MQATQATTLGWIGTGAMGLPMCGLLLDAGHAMVVYDAARERVAPLLDRGAQRASSAQEVAQRADIVFSSIYDDAALRDVVLGASGLLAGASTCRLYVDMSTVSPQASAEVALALQQRGVSYLRAPVSGTVALARTAQLRAFVSGERAAYDEVLPLLRHLSAKQSYVGGADEARVIKLLINMMVFVSTSVLGEALSLGASLGLDRNTVIDAVNDSIVGSAHYSVKAPKLKAREYSAAGAIDLVAKDLDMALQVARHSACPLPIASTVRQQIASLQHRGLGALDVALMAEFADLSLGQIDNATLLHNAAH